MMFGRSVDINESLLFGPLIVDLPSDILWCELDTGHKSMQGPLLAASVFYNEVLSIVQFLVLSSTYFEVIELGLGDNASWQLLAGGEPPRLVHVEHFRSRDCGLLRIRRLLEQAHCIPVLAHSQ